MSNPFTEQWLADRLARQSKPLRMEIVDVGPKRLKYGNKKTEIDGITFDSKREATRYQDLRYMEAAGEISDLKLQVSYPLIVNGVKIATYRSDFDYIENGQKITEDCKGVRTREFITKRRLMLALYGIHIRET